MTKTHLLHSIGHQQLANRPSARIVYLPTHWRAAKCVASCSRPIAIGMRSAVNRSVHSPWRRS